MARRISKIGRTEAAGKFVRPVDAGTICSPRVLIICEAGVFVVALALYVWTLAPTVTFVDSGELIVVARFLGVAHPPGAPLWVMLAHLASLVPWGNVASRIHFASALFAALAASMLTLAVAELLMISSWIPQTKRAIRPAQARQRGETETHSTGKSGTWSNNLSVLIPAVGSGLLLAFSRTLWSYATIAEVYTLNVLLTLTIFFLMLGWRRRILAQRSTSGAAKSGNNLVAITDYDNFLYAAAFTFGLALGVHHVTVALTLPAICLIVYQTEGLAFFRSRRFLFAALFSLVALVAVYSYLPLAAARSPIINWGNPQSLKEIWWHVSGRQYQVFLAFTPNALGVQFLQLGRVVLREFGLPWIPVALGLAIAGIVHAFKRDRTAFWFIALLILVDLAYALAYDIAEDKEAYYLPAFIAIAAAAGLGLRWLISGVATKPWSARNGCLVAAVSVLIASAIALIGNWPFNNRRQYFVAHDYVENLFKAMQPNGLLLTFDWQVASPMLFAQEVERRRPDIRIVDINLLRRPWYFDYLRKACPGLIERSREQIDPFLAELKAWEQDPQLYEADRTLNRRINVLFDEMIRAIVMNEERVAPIYVTFDVPSADDRGGEAIRWLQQNYQFVPQGLVFRLTGDAAYRDSPEVKLEMRGLADGTLRFEPDDVVALKIFPVYTSMLINRGRYLAQHQQHGRAMAAFRQALALDPNLAPAQQGLQQSMDKLGKP